MSKKFILFIIIIVIIVIAYLIYQPKEKFTLDAKNCSYIVEAKEIVLEDGYSEEEIAPGSASKLITQYFGNEVSGDLNEDGFSDIVFILTQNSGGSGTFYYLAAALGADLECKGSKTILLGDRITPQTIEIENGEIIVNYADRKIDEAMAVPPSITISKRFVLEDMTLKDITSEETKKEQACLLSGGTVEMSSCCISVSDFPDTCLTIGACGCPPAGSHQIKTCLCEEGKCFNGEECIAIESLNQNRY